MTVSNHALTFDYGAGGVTARCSCGWTTRTTTNALAITAHNAHLTLRGVATRTYV